VILFGKSLWDETLVLLQEGLELHPANPDMIRGLAEVLFKKGDSQQAVQFAEAALRQYPDMPEKERKGLAAELETYRSSLRDKARKKD